LWAHIGWILFKVLPEPPLDNVADLRKDRLVMLQHRTDKLIAVGVGLLLPTLLGYLWKGPQGAMAGFLIVGALRVFVVQQCTFFINSLCHTIGRQPYSSSCSARDSTVMAFLTFGEGYHNFHHRFQHDYRNGVKPWAFDPTKWTINLLAKVGLVSGLRRVPEHRILLAEMEEARRQVEERLARIDEMGESVCTKTLQAVIALEKKLAEAYQELEQVLARKAEVSRQTLEQWRRQTRELVDQVSRLVPEPA
jgi:stearoyl-CoA desaturase (delta-9 desaturase)